MRALLSGHPGERTHPALALQLEHALVELPGEHHMGMKLL